MEDIYTLSQCAIPAQPSGPIFSMNKDLWISIASKFTPVVQNSSTLSGLTGAVIYARLEGEPLLKSETHHKNVYHALLQNACLIEAYENTRFERPEHVRPEQEMADIKRTRLG